MTTNTAGTMARAALIEIGQRLFATGGLTALRAALDGCDTALQRALLAEAWRSIGPAARD